MSADWVTYRSFANGNLDLRAISALPPPNTAGRIAIADYVFNQRRWFVWDAESEMGERTHRQRRGQSRPGAQWLEGSSNGPPPNSSPACPLCGSWGVHNRTSLQRNSAYGAMPSCTQDLSRFHRQGLKTKIAERNHRVDRQSTGPSGKKTYPAQKTASCKTDRTIFGTNFDQPIRPIQGRDAPACVGLARGTGLRLFPPKGTCSSTSIILRRIPNNSGLAGGYRVLKLYSHRFARRHAMELHHNSGTNGKLIGVRLKTSIIDPTRARALSEGAGLGADVLFATITPPPPFYPEKTTAGADTNSFGNKLSNPRPGWGRLLLRCQFYTPRVVSLAGLTTTYFRGIRIAPMPRTQLRPFVIHYTPGGFDACLCQSNKPRRKLELLGTS